MSDIRSWLPDGAYSSNPDGTGLRPAEPLGWQEEHNWFERLVLWLRRIEHCNDREGQRRSARPTMWRNCGEGVKHAPHRHLLNGAECWCNGSEDDDDPPRRALTGDA